MNNNKMNKYKKIKKMNSNRNKFNNKMNSNKIMK